MGEQALYVWQALLPVQDRAGGGGVETLHVRLVEDGAVHVRTEEAPLQVLLPIPRQLLLPPLQLTHDLPPPPLQPLPAPPPHRLPMGGGLISMMNRLLIRDLLLVLKGIFSCFVLWRQFQLPQLSLPSPRL